MTTLWELIEHRAGQTPDRLMALDEDGRQLTFDQYRGAAEQVAAGLWGRGIGPGIHVSWELPTWIESMVLVGALSRLGAVQNPMLPIYRGREVGFIARQTGARLLVVPSVWRGFDYEAMAHEVASDSGGVDVLVVDPADRRLPEGDPATLPPPPDIDGDPVRWIFYTSGTTADPKGAQHTDGTLMATATGMSGVLDLRADDRVALVFPFTHIGGITWLLAGLMAGSAGIVVEQFDPATTIPMLAANDVTLAGAGTAFHVAYLSAQRALAEKEPGAKLFRRVRAFPGGGAPKPPQLHYDIKAEMGGVGIVSGYGLTECPILAMNTVGDPDDKLAETEGRATPDVTIRVVTLDGRATGPGEDGEIRVTGPQLCHGYVDPSLAGEAFDADGFLRTGDIGHLDEDGFITITGRLKDVIIRKGENISAKEIEDLLYQHPKVADVAVVGLPDPASGERACAVVAPRDPGDPLGLAEMVTYLRGQKLMVQKIPEQLEIVVQVPRNASGKVEKQKLREQFTTGGAT